MTMKAAQQLVKKRWDRTTEEERKEIASELGKASAAKLTPEQRSERARKAAFAKHGKKKQKRRDKAA